MPHWFGALFLMGIGAGVLLVAYGGYLNGVLPAGSKFVRAFRPSRKDNPLAFYGFLLLYFCSGLALEVWGPLSLIGMAPPLPLH